MTAYQARAQRRRERVIRLAVAHPDWTFRQIAKAARIGFQLAHYHLRRAGFRMQKVRIKL